MLHTFQIMKKKEKEFWFAYSDEDSMPNNIIDKSVNLNGTKDKLILELLEKNLIAWETSKEKKKRYNARNLWKYEIDI